jgi:asparagine synthase (glutamine-hydrolysing)
VKLLSQDDLLTFLPEMIRLQDEPIADPVCVPVYYLSKLARDNGVKVCQLGEGADELFCGYPTWDLRIQLQKFDDLPVPRILKKAGLPLLDLYGLGKDFHYEYLRRGSLGQPIFWSGAETYPHKLKQKLLSPRLKKAFNGYTSWEALAPTRKRFQENAWDQAHLNWMTYSDLNLRLPELLLMRVDKMGMGASVEGRVPFLDHKFVEFVMSIPSEIKTRNRELKYILKKAVRGVIPDEIIDRKKQGFAVPIREWIDDELGAHMSRELKKFCDESDLLEWSEVERALNDPRRRPTTWTLLNSALWWKEFVR